MCVSVSVCQIDLKIRGLEKRPKSVYIYILWQVGVVGFVQGWSANSQTMFRDGAIKIDLFAQDRWQQNRMRNSVEA